MMKLKSATLLLLLVTFFVTNGCKENEFNPFCTITGVVTDSETGAAIPDAMVTLVPKSVSVPTSRTTQTTPEGVFSFEELDEGLYTVSVQKNGYQPDHKDITAVSGETIQTVVQIKKNPISQ